MKISFAIVILFVSNLTFAQQRQLVGRTPWKAALPMNTFQTDSVLTKVGQWGWGPCYGVAVQGNYAYIGNGATLTVLDVSDPANPKAVGELFVGDLVGKVAVSGNYAYTISPFRIIDISNPRNPVLVSTPQLPGPYPPEAVAVKGNYAYVGDFYGDIFIIDISNRANPQAKGWMLTTNEMVGSIVVQDTILYASSAGPGIDVFNISNPDSAYRVRRLSYGFTWGPVALSGHYLYSATPFQVFDISDPPNPRYVGGITLGSWVYSISVVDTIAFIGLSGGVFAALDVSNTNNIHVIGNIQNPYSFPGDDQAVHFPYAYLASGTGLWIVNVSEPRLLASVSFFPTGWYVNRIAVDSSQHAFLAELAGGLKILDFSDPSVPHLVGHYEPKEEVRDVAVAGNFAYLLCDSGLQVLDVSVIGSPRLIGTVSFNDTVTTTAVGSFDFLCLKGSTIYAARKSQKLFAVDLENPNHPTIKSTYHLRQIPAGISQSSGYLYVADSDTGIQIFTISDPNVPHEEGFLRIVPLRGLATAKDKLFAVGWEGTGLGQAALAEYDITSPLDPNLKYILNIPGGIGVVALKTNKTFAYLAYNNTFLVVDISNPDSGKIVYSGNAIALGAGAFNSVAASNGIALTGYMGVCVFKNTLVTSVRENHAFPKSFELSQNFPNPFNPGTIIKYRLSATSRVTLKVYDILGREVATLVDEIKDAGYHTATFDGSKFSSGIYFARFVGQSEEGKPFVQTRKLLLMK